MSFFYYYLRWVQELQRERSCPLEVGSVRVPSGDAADDSERSVCVIASTRELTRHLEAVAREQSTQSLVEVDSCDTGQRVGESRRREYE